MVFILKLLVGVIGLGFALFNLIPGVTKNDKQKLKKAAWLFFLTWMAIIVISVSEFYYYVK